MDWETIEKIEKWSREIVAESLTRAARRRKMRGRFHETHYPVTLNTIRLAHAVVEKWICMANDPDGVEPPCAFCTVFAQGYSEGGRCKLCPICVFTGMQGCFGTPYTDSEPSMADEELEFVQDILRALIDYHKLCCGRVYGDFLGSENDAE